MDINPARLKSYIRNLSRKGTDDKTVERKLASVGKFLQWAQQKGIIKKKLFSELLLLLQISQSLPTQKTATAPLTSPPKEAIVAPEPAFPFAKRYAVIAALVLIGMGISMGIFKANFSKPRPASAGINTLTPASRSLSFQGRLTDPLGNAITNPTNITLNVYNSEHSQDVLYTSGTCFVRPDPSGMISVTLGRSCGAQVPNETFAKNQYIYLGITVGTDSEMKPRQKIPTVGLAADTKSLEGFAKGTTAQSIPYIDTNGNISLASPVAGIYAMAESANFTIGSSKTLTIQSGGTGDLSLETKNSGNLLLKTRGIARAVIQNNGNVGIGTIFPTSLFAVGNNGFAVNSSGNITHINGLSYSFPLTSGLPGSMLTNDGRGNLAWSTLASETVSADSFDFVNLKDVLKVDAPTRIDLSSYGLTFDATDTGNMTVNLTSTGDFAIQDSGTTFATFSDSGVFTVDNIRFDGNKVDTTSGHLTLDSSGGNVGIGTTSPQDKLDVAGDIRVGTGTGGCVKDADGTPIAGACSSDSRLKKNITSVTDVLEKLTQLQAVSYQWDSQNHPEYGFGSDSQLGFIAQDVELVFPELVATDSRGFKTLDYGPRLSVLTIQAVKELADRVQALQEEASEKLVEAKIVTNERINGGMMDFQEASIGKLAAVRAFISDLTVDTLTVNQKVVSPVIETELLKAKTVESQTVKAKEITTEEINSDLGDVTINLNKTPRPQGKLATLIIKGLEDATVASIDAQGNVRTQGDVNAKNATLSGTLASSRVQSDELETKDATVSGRLVAGEIESATITNLSQRASSLEDRLTSLSTSQPATPSATTNTDLMNEVNEIQKLLADIRKGSLPNPKYYGLQTSDLGIKNEATGSGQLELADVSLTGTTNLFEAYISNSLTAGNVLFEDETVRALGQELKLSALSTINLLDGAVLIGRDGTITTQGTLIAKGGIKTTKVEVTNGDTKVASIDSSGRGTFSQLALNKFTPKPGSTAILSATENLIKRGTDSPAIETSAEVAGRGTLPQGEEEVIIYNDTIKEDSLVYLTPTSPVTVGQLAVVKKQACAAGASGCQPSFIVSLGSRSTSEITFDWLIIN